MFFSKISNNFIYQPKEIWCVRLYQKMIEISQEKIKLRILVYKKEIRQVKLALTKKIIPTRTFLFFYWKRIAEDASCIFLKFYSKFPFDLYINICILEFRKKRKNAQIKRKRTLCMGIFFSFFYAKLYLSSYFLPWKAND